MARRLIAAVVAAAWLGGCGVGVGPGPAKGRSGQVGTNSYQGAARGVRAMYLAAFKSADKDENGYLTLQEMMPALPAHIGLAPTEPARAAKALFDALDLNKDGKVRFREFTNPQVLQAAIATFRHEVGKTFASLDRNGDRVLIEAELVKTPVTLEAADRNRDGKLTISEFEDAFAATLGQGPEPGEPPTAEPPAPAEPGGEEPPAAAPAVPGTP
ncbi:MAG: EF-hand domain-containing protein [Candidatus Sericytochromatia bacterium]|nr:EF-hand domain-containing protein [Candidatus Sericytochromatia bacterium]